MTTDSSVTPIRVATLYINGTMMAYIRCSQHCRLPSLFHYTSLSVATTVVVHNGVRSLSGSLCVGVRLCLFQASYHWRCQILMLGDVSGPSPKTELHVHRTAMSYPKALTSILIQKEWHFVSLPYEQHATGTDLKQWNKMQFKLFYRFSGNAGSLHSSALWVLSPSPMGSLEFETQISATTRKTWTSFTVRSGTTKTNQY